MPEYEGTERRQAFHLSRTFSIGHIVSTAVLVVAGFTWAGDLEKQILTNSHSVESLGSRMDRTDERHSEQFGEIKSMLKSMAVKIDRLGERRER
jgi:hypothetical protein